MLEMILRCGFPLGILREEFVVWRAGRQKPLRWEGAGHEHAVLIQADSFARQLCLLLQRASVSVSVSWA